MRLMRYVRVISCILDHDGLSPALAHLAPLDGEADAPLLPLAGKLYLYLALHFTVKKSFSGSFRRSGGTAAGSPAGPELLALDPLHARGHRGFADLATSRHRVLP